MDPLDRTTAEAARNHGIISREVALRCGMSPRQIERRVTTGRWRRVHPGVYLIPPAPLTFIALCAAALAAVPKPAVLSGLAAAHLLGWCDREPESPIDVVHPRRRRVQGVRVCVDPEMCRYPNISFEGLPISPLEVTMFFCAARSNDSDLHRLLQEARKRGLREHRLRQTVNRLGGHGRRGAALLNRRMEAVFGNAPTDSSLEDLFLPHLKRRRLEPILQGRIYISGRYVRRGDFVFFPEKVDAETDGRDAHSGARFDKDRSVDRLLMEHGWLVPRYTWKDITEDPEGAAKDLARLVRSRQQRFRLGP